MRLALVSLLFAAAAHADPPAPDLTLTWEEGEVSLDMSMWRSTLTITGSQIHYESTYMGRNAGMPFTKPHKADATFQDPKQLAALLAAFDQAPVQARKHDDEPYSGNELTACITRGKTTRCVTQRSGDPASAEVDAATALESYLLGKFKLADLI